MANSSSNTTLVEIDLGGWTGVFGDQVAAQDGKNETTGEINEMVLMYEDGR